MRCLDRRSMANPFYRFTFASLISGLCSMRFIGGRGGRLNDIEATLKLR